MYRRTVILVFRTLMVGVLLLSVLGSAEAVTDDYPPVFKDIQLSSTTVTGEESLTFYVTAEDSISGVGYVYVQAVSPSGSRQGEVHMFSQDSLGRWYGSLQISKYDEPGEWKIRFIRIEDKAGNYWSRTYDEGGAIDGDSTGIQVRVEGLMPMTFTVEGTRYDNSSPAFSNLELSSTTVKPGESVTFYVTAEDSISGVAYVSVQAISPSGSQLGEVYMFNQDSSGRWYGNLRTSEYTEQGEWKVRYILVEDKVNNYWSRTYDESGAIEKESTGSERRIEGLMPMTFTVGDDTEAMQKYNDIDNTLSKILDSELTSLELVEEALVELNQTKLLIYELPDRFKIPLLEKYEEAESEILIKLTTILEQKQYSKSSQLGPQSLDLFVRYSIQEVKAETIHDRGLVLDFAKPIAKGLVTGDEINKLIIKYLG